MSDALAASFINTHPKPLAGITVDVSDIPGAVSLGLGDYHIPAFPQGAVLASFEGAAPGSVWTIIAVPAREIEGSLNNALIANFRAGDEFVSTNAAAYQNADGVIIDFASKITPDNPVYGIELEFDSGARPAPTAVVVAVNGQFVARLLFGSLEVTSKIPLPYGGKNDFTEQGRRDTGTATILSGELEGIENLAYLETAFLTNQNSEYSGSLYLGMFNPVEGEVEAGFPSTTDWNVGKYGAVITTKQPIRGFSEGLLLFDATFWLTTKEI